MNCTSTGGLFRFIFSVTKRHEVGISEGQQISSLLELEELSISVIVSWLQGRSGKQMFLKHWGLIPLSFLSSLYLDDVIIIRLYINSRVVNHTIVELMQNTNIEYLIVPWIYHHIPTVLFFLFQKASFPYRSI